MRKIAKGLKPAAVLAVIAGGSVATLLFAAAMLVVAPRQAAATAQWAEINHMPCGGCHVNPAGGGKLNNVGLKFQLHGHKF
ncbi:MAG TPA: hypothetical protein VK430_12615 [Xanthobacteraceae bacterium]|nr:hypothetical protein [Xanthobacteraceae bacterium]